jgi:hypothetical protein
MTQAEEYLKNDISERYTDKHDDEIIEVSLHAVNYAMKKYALDCLEKAYQNVRLKHIEEYDEVMGYVLSSKTVVDKESITSKENLV